jgi:hypothetical protein
MVHFSLLAGKMRAAGYRKISSSRNRITFATTQGNAGGANAAITSASTKGRFWCGGLDFRRMSLSCSCQSPLAPVLKDEVVCERLIDACEVGHSLSRLHQLDTIFKIFEASERD